MSQSNRVWNPINRVLFGKPAGATKTVWVVASFTTESSTFDWFSDESKAIEAYSAIKVITPSQELTQHHYFAFEVAEGMPVDDITDAIDDFYDSNVSKVEFYDSEHIQCFPYTAEGWNYIVNNLLG